MAFKKNNAYITISRLWHNPQIATTINQEGIALNISFEDFIKTLKWELKQKLPIVSKKGLNKKLDKVIDNILEGIKAESAKVM